MTLIIVLDWYKKFNIKIVESSKYSEFWGGKEVISREYAFKFKKLNKKKLKIFLEYIEQECIVCIDLDMPIYFNKIRFDGKLQELDYLKLLSKININETKRIVEKLCKAADKLKKNVILQRRIDWELDKKNEWYSVYGRFACVII